MSSLLRQQPLEIRKKIFDLCTKPDLINMAVCSRFWYEEVVRMIWCEVTVTWRQLLEKEIDTNTANLRHTQKITFNGETQHPDECFAFASIVKNCDPSRLTSLRFFGYIVPDGLKLVAEKLPNLRSLYIHGISERLRLDLLTRFQLLETISLHKCQVTDEEVKGICRLKNLRTLKLSDRSAKVTSQSLNYISHLTELKELFLSMYQEIAESGQLNRTIPKLQHLVRLKIPYSHIDEDFFKFVKKNNQVLEILDIRMSRFSGQVLPSIFKLHNLRQLDLSDCSEFTNAEFASINQLHRLKRLSLDRTAISDEGARYVSKLLALKSLSLLRCKMLTDTALKYISQLPLLEFLDIGINDNYTDDGVAYLKSLQNLQILWMPTMNVTDRSLRYLSELYNLRRLDICSCPAFTDNGLLHLNSLPYLERVNCWDCEGLTVERVVYDKN